MQNTATYLEWNKKKVLIKKTDPAPVCLLNTPRTILHLLFKLFCIPADSGWRPINMPLSSDYVYEWVSPAMRANMWKLSEFFRIKETFQLYCTVITLQQTSIGTHHIKFHWSTITIINDYLFNSIFGCGFDLWCYAISLRHLMVIFLHLIYIWNLLGCHVRLQLMFTGEQYTNKRQSIQKSMPILSDSTFDQIVTISKEWSVWDPEPNCIFQLFPLHCNHMLLLISS